VAINIASTTNAIKAGSRRDNRAKVKEVKVRLSRTLRNMMTPQLRLPIRFPVKLEFHW